MSKEIADRIEAAKALRDTFSQLSNKSEAWQDLFRLIQDKDNDEEYNVEYNVEISQENLIDRSPINALYSIC